MPLTDSWLLLDNSMLKPIEVAKCDHGKIKVLNKSLYKELMEGRDDKS